MQMLALMKNMHHEDFQAKPLIEEPPYEAINATPFAIIQNETLKVLQDLQKQLHTLTQQNGNNGNNGREKNNINPPDNASFKRADTGKCCWSHEACSHNSNECNRKAPRHKNNATKDNKIGGFKAFCEWELTHKVVPGNNKIVKKIHVATSFKCMKDTNLDNIKKNVKYDDYYIAKGDTGASSHYFMKKNKDV